LNGIFIYYQRFKVHLLLVFVVLCAAAKLAGVFYFTFSFPNLKLCEQKKCRTKPVRKPALNEQNKKAKLSNAKAIRSKSRTAMSTAAKLKLIKLLNFCLRNMLTFSPLNFPLKRPICKI